MTAQNKPFLWLPLPSPFPLPPYRKYCEGKTAKLLFWEIVQVTKANIYINVQIPDMHQCCRIEEL